MPDVRRASTVVLWIALASLLALVAAGCGGSGSDGAEGADRTGDGEVRVMVVGDSVTVLSKDELRRRFAWADALDVRAHSGYRTDQLLEGARAGAEAAPDIGVFLPGYNDVLQDNVDSRALPEMMAVAADLPCAVWLLLPTDGGYAPDLVRIWNERVRTLASGHDEVKVIDDWKKLVEASPDFTFVSEADAVHPNRDGQKAIAEVMSDRARSACS